MSTSNDYTVYVYIHPRNYEEFYFGKGRGSRKDVHLSDSSDSEKAKRIAAILKEGLQPIVRVIAKGLSEHDALLVEKTLLWKLGRQLTNISSGHYASNFRPYNTLHLELTGFDYRCGFYYYNIGEGPHRNWDDYREFGFNEGDVVAAYLKGAGFVGIGKLCSAAKPINQVLIGGKPLLSHNLRCSGMADNESSVELCEYVATVKWLKAVDRAEAKMQRKSGIYTTTHVRASLDGQPKTVAFLEPSRRN